jgi:hypothetical protein
MAMRIEAPMIMQLSPLTRFLAQPGGMLLFVVISLLVTGLFYYFIWREVISKPRSRIRQLELRTKFLEDRIKALEQGDKT